jgi:hypothetical protein
MHPPPSPAQPNFTLMSDCTPESRRYHSMYSVLVTKSCIAMREYRKEYGRGHRVHRVVTSAYWLCQVLYISVHRCHCWQVCVTFFVVFSFLFSDV